MMSTMTYTASACIVASVRIQGTTSPIARARINAGTNVMTVKSARPVRMKL